MAKRSRANQQGPASRDAGAPDPRWTVRVENVPVELIDEDPDNAREHDEDNLTSVGDSLERYGLQKPIVVVPVDGGRFRCIAGNGTLRVARRMGAETISVSVSGLQGLDRVGYAIADNKTAETSTWNYGRLRVHLEKLQAASFPMPATGWAALEIRNLLAFRGQPEPARPAEPAPPDDPPARAPGPTAPPADAGPAGPAAGPVIKSEVFVLNPEEVELLDRIAEREGIANPKPQQRLRDALVLAIRRCSGAELAAAAE